MCSLARLCLRRRRCARRLDIRRRQLLCCRPELPPRPPEAEQNAPRARTFSYCTFRQRCWTSVAYRERVQEAEERSTYVVRRQAREGQVSTLSTLCSTLTPAGSEANKSKCKSNSTRYRPSIDRAEAARAVLSTSLYHVCGVRRLPWEFLASAVPLYSIWLSVPPSCRSRTIHLGRIHSRGVPFLCSLRIIFFALLLIFCLPLRLTTEGSHTGRIRARQGGGGSCCPSTCLTRSPRWRVVLHCRTVQFSVGLRAVYLVSATGERLTDRQAALGEGSEVVRAVLSQFNLCTSYEAGLRAGVRSTAVEDTQVGRE